MPDVRLDRIAAIAEHLAAVDPPAIRAARQRFAVAQRDLAEQRRLGSDVEVLGAYTYRAERALDGLRDSLRALSA